MKNLLTTNTAKLVAYFSLVIFAFINPYLVKQLVITIQIYIEQYV